jgi:hypothetical protein
LDCILLEDSHSKRNRVDFAGHLDFATRLEAVSFYVAVVSVREGFGYCGASGLCHCHHQRHHQDALVDVVVVFVATTFEAEWKILTPLPTAGSVKGWQQQKQSACSSQSFDDNIFK